MYRLAATAQRHRQTDSQLPIADVPNKTGLRGWDDSNAGKWPQTGQVGYSGVNCKHTSGIQVDSP